MLEKLQMPEIYRITNERLVLIFFFGSRCLLTWRVVLQAPTYRCTVCHIQHSANFPCRTLQRAIVRKMDIERVLRYRKAEMGMVQRLKKASVQTIHCIFEGYFSPHHMNPDRIARMRLDPETLDARTEEERSRMREQTTQRRLAAITDFRQDNGDEETEYFLRWKRPKNFDNGSSPEELEKLTDFVIISYDLETTATTMQASAVSLQVRTMHGDNLHRCFDEEEALPTWMEGDETLTETQLLRTFPTPYARISHFLSNKNNELVNWLKESLFPDGHLHPTRPEYFIPFSQTRRRHGVVAFAHLYAL